MLCFRKLPAAKKFMDRREGEVSRFSGEKFLSHSAEKVRRATFCASFFFGYRKSLDERVVGGGNVKIFC